MLKSKVSLKTNIIMNAILVMSSLVFPLITFPYTSRTLGPEGIGIVNMATSFASCFIGFSQLGIPLYGIRACAQVKNNRHELTKVTHELIIINTVLSVFSYLLFFLFVFFIDELRDEKILYIIMSSTITFNLIGMEWLYKGLEQYEYITYRSLLFKIIAIIALLVLVKSEKDYLLYGVVTILANSFSCVMNFINARKYISFKPIGKYGLKKHMKPIIIIYALSVATSVYENLDNVMLGFLCDETAVGFYSTSIKFKNLLVGFVTSVGAVLIPRAANYMSRDKVEDVISIMQKAIRFVIICAGPLVCFFMLYAKEAVFLIASEEYLRAIEPMVVIMPTLLIVGLSYNIGMSVFIPLGKEIFVCYSAIVGAVVDFIVNLIFIPHLKETGAAIGTLVAEAAVLIVQIYLLKKKTVYGKILSGHPVFKTLFCIVLCGVISQLSAFYINDSFVKLVVAGVTFFTLYVIMLAIIKEPLLSDVLCFVKTKIFKRAN